MLLDGRQEAIRLVLCLFVLGVGAVASDAQQTPGRLAKFDTADDRDCHEGGEHGRAGRDRKDHKPDCNAGVVDSGVTEDPQGNIGIGTDAPRARLDVVGGNVNLERSSSTGGNILKQGEVFIHDFGVRNTFVGRGAGIISGEDSSDNSVLGFAALQNNVSGGQNTAVGAYALQTSRFAVFNTAIGYGALANNVIGIQNTGIGNIALFRNEGSQNTAAGNAALINNTTGLGNTALGHNSLIGNETGDYNTAIGTRANVSGDGFVNATAIGFDAIVDASNKIRLGNTQVAVIEGQVPYTYTSDRSRKEKFQAVDGEAVLSRLRALPVTSWNYIGHDATRFRHYGPVAQDFYAAFGHDGVGAVGTPTTINSGDLAGILMIAVQALEQRTAEVASLTERIAALEARERNRASSEQASESFIAARSRQPE